MIARPRRVAIAEPSAALIALLTESREWMLDGLCNGKATRGDDPWFPEADKRAQTASAQRICAQCPVEQECLRFALDSPEPHGVWGGTSPRQRRALRRREAAA